MPKRSNPFQKLIALVERLLAPYATVEESVELIDRTGASREVDVLVKGAVGSHEVSVAIECRDHTRRATVEWIDALAGKYRELPTVDRIVAVSRSGFSKNATKKAAALGISALTLSDASKANWVAAFHAVRTVRVENFLLPFVVEVAVVFSKEDGLETEATSLPEAELLSPAEESLGTLRQYVASFVQRQDVLHAIHQHPDAEDGKTAIWTMEVQLHPGSTVRVAGGLVPVQGLRLKVKSRKETHELDFDHALYGKAWIASGQMSAMGHELTIAMAQTPAGQPQVGFSAARKPSAKSKPKRQRKRSRPRRPRKR